MKTDRDHARSILRGITPLAYFRTADAVEVALAHTILEVRLQKRLALVIGFCTGFGFAGLMFMLVSLLSR